MSKIKIKMIKAAICLCLCCYCTVLAAQSFGFLSLFEWQGVFGIQTLDFYVGIKACIGGIVSMLYGIMASCDAYLCHKGREWLVD